MTKSIFYQYMIPRDNGYGIIILVGFAVYLGYMWYLISHMNDWYDEDKYDIKRNDPNYRK